MNRSTLRRDAAGLGMTSQRARDRLVERLRVLGIEHRGVLEAMRQLPRHWFVDEGLESRAYEDSALPIGLGQTISQPYIVARMTELLLASQPKKVLEIGTGSGYQAALLALLVEQVFSVERIDSLLRNARRRLRALKIENVRTRHRDGRLGWAEEAPFDAIIVTAAGAVIEPSLLAQLAPDGVLLAPVGSASEQRLIRVQRTLSGFQEQVFEAVVFVPLLGGTL